MDKSTQDLSPKTLVKVEIKPKINLKYWINETAIWAINFIKIFLDTYFIR